MNKELLEKRNKDKKKKPDFVVKESNFFAGVKRRWRFPRGKHSAVRQMHKGRPALPQPGYGSPRAVLGLDTSGLRPVVVHNEEELMRLDKAIEGALIAKTVGQKKKLALLQKAQELQISLLNEKDLTKAIQDIERAFAERTEARKKRLQQKDKKENEKKKKAEEKQKQLEKKEKEKEQSETVEEKVQKEEELKKEMEKTITKRQ